MLNRGCLEASLSLFGGKFHALVADMLEICHPAGIIFSVIASKILQSSTKELYCRYKSLRIRMQWLIQNTCPFTNRKARNLASDALYIFVSFQWAWSFRLHFFELTHPIGLGVCYMKLSPCKIHQFFFFFVKFSPRSRETLSMPFWLVASTQSAHQIETFF